MPRAKLTKRFIDSLPLTAQGQQLYWDTDMNGFGICVGTNSKSYLVQRDVHGKGVRYTIGKHGIFTTEQARKQAQVLLTQMAQGINPKALKQEQRIKGATLADLWEQYKESGANRLTDKTISGYDEFFRNQFSDWQNKPVAELTKEMIVKRHQKITEEFGKSMANSSMHFLRALYNYASIDNEGLSNPVEILSKKKLWHPTTRRQSIITENQLADWYAAVKNLHNSTIRDALLFLLFTGLRKMEALTLQWEQVDLEAKTFKVLITKNKQPLTLPLSEFLYELLSARHKQKGDSPFVFPSSGAAGHLVEPKKAVAQVIKESEVKFMLHDLRRTFITTAERLDISAYALKRLVNHKNSNDVTSGYIVMDVERLREPMERVAGYLIEKMRLPIG
jgi:integrase